MNGPGLDIPIQFLLTRGSDGNTKITKQCDEELANAKDKGSETHWVFFESHVIEIGVAALSNVAGMHQQDVKCRE